MEEKLNTNKEDTIKEPLCISCKHLFYNIIPYTDNSHYPTINTKCLITDVALKGTHAGQYYEISKGKLIPYITVCSLYVETETNLLEDIKK